MTPLQRTKALEAQKIRVPAFTEAVLTLRKQNAPTWQIERAELVRDDMADVLRKMLARTPVLELTA